TIRRPPPARGRPRARRGSGWSRPAAQVVTDLLPRAAAAALLHHAAGPTFDLSGPCGLDIRIGLTIEARQQLGGQLGALVDREPKGGAQQCLGLLGHLVIVAATERANNSRGPARAAATCALPTVAE